MRHLTPSLKPFYGEEDGIIWLGFIGDENKRIEILRGVDGFILPSLVEGLSISLLEAMACGIACMATDVGADGEVLKGAGIVLETKGLITQLKTLLPVLRGSSRINHNFRSKSPSKSFRLLHSQQKY
jgi:glycosyltransferase involved in cell wall biosynthesis